MQLDWQQRGVPGQTRCYATEVDDFDELPSDLDWKPQQSIPTRKEQEDNKRGYEKRKEIRARDTLNSEDRTLGVRLQDRVLDLLAWAKVTKDDSNFPVTDAIYYAQHDEYPQHFQYPSLPKQFFDQPPIISTDALQEALPKQNLQFRSKHAVLIRSDQYIWRTELSVQCVDAEFVAIGEDTDVELAKNAAHAHLFLQMHRGGHLGRWLSTTTRVDPPVTNGEAKTLSRAPLSSLIPVEQIRQDPDAKLHAYNFAAQLLTTPDITVRRHKSHFVGTIRLKEAEIQAFASASSAEDAELAACIAFKREVEARRKQSGEEPLSLRRADALNLDNAGEIISLYEYETKRNIKFMSKAIQATTHGKHWSITALDGKNPITAPVIMQTYNEGKLVARLAAAVKLVAADPLLLQRYLDFSRQGVFPRHILPIELRLRPGSTKFLSSTLNLTAHFEPNETKDLAEARSFDQSLPLSYAENSAIKVRNFMHSTTLSREARSRDLKQRQEGLLLDQRFREHQTALHDFPISQHRAQILKMISDHPYSIIIGATGSGKSTLVPQMLLETAINEGNGALCNIICTEPRRIAAMSLAQRVARDRFEELGEVAGYHIGNEIPKVSRLGGSITYCTPEIVYFHLEDLQDEFMTGISHVIVDEIHERSEQTERFLGALKLAILRRVKQGLSAPKVILMSATVPGKFYSNYFEYSTYFNEGSDGSKDPMPSMIVPGRLYPIEKVYLDEIMEDLRESYSPLRLKSMLNQSHTQRYVSSETQPDDTGSWQRSEEQAETVPPIIDWKSQYEIVRDDLSPLFSQQLVAAKIAQLLRTTHDGSILVFLPGWREMTGVEQLLQQPQFGNLDFSENSRYKIVLLHSENPVSPELQLQSIPPDCRRIILATNMAESSLTFADVKYVVDAGKHRKPDWIHDLDVNKLQLDWASQSSMIQRAGRAGRVQSGSYYGLYSKSRPGSVPETTSTSLVDPYKIQTISIRAKLAFPDLSIKEFFSQYIEPFPSNVIESAIAELKATNALRENEEPTHFGMTVARFGYDPSAVKMAILGAMLQCLQPALILVALRQGRSIFASALRPSEKEMADTTRRKYAAGTRSDHIAEVNAYLDLAAIHRSERDDTARRFAREHFLHYDNFIGLNREVRRLSLLMRRLGLTHSTCAAALNSRSADDAVLKALLVSASGLAVHRSGYRYHTAKGVDGILREASLTRPPEWRAGTWMPNPLKAGIVAYSELVSTSSVAEHAYLRGTTPVSGLAVALFGRALEASGRDGEGDVLLVDGWVPLRVRDEETRRAVLELRRVWDGVVKGAVYGRGLSGENGDGRALKLVSSIVVDLLADAERSLAGMGNANGNGSANEHANGNGGN